MSPKQTLSFQIQDVSGQRQYDVRDVPPDALWGDVLETIVGQMSLPPNHPESTTNNWSGRLDRTGSNLQVTDRVGETLESGDLVVLEPEVIAGGSGRC